MKTDKYIVTDVKPERLFPGERQDIGRTAGYKSKMPTHVMWLDNTVVPGACYSECVWIWPECSSEKSVAEAHRHDFPEILTFFGTNWEKPKELCGEVELWLDGEKHIMTRSFLAYIPARMLHCPLITRNIKQPIFHFSVGLGGDYIRK